MIYKPFEYQEYAEQFVLDRESSALLLDMGLGKTVITLTAIEKLLRDYLSVSRVLVIAPLMTAKNTWPQEIRKWEHLQGLTYSLILGTASERLAAMDADADIYIINRENVAWLVEECKRRKRWKWDCVVVDELSSFKSSKSQRFRALKKVRSQIKRFIGLTGTPAPNGLLDLWPQMFLIDGGAALGKTVTGYRDSYFLPDKRNAMTVFSYKLKDGAEEEIYERLEPSCVSMKSADYLDLPERVDVMHEVELSDEVLAKYKKLEKDMALELIRPDIPAHNCDIDAVSAGVLANKLLQFCGGVVYDESGNPAHFHDEKLIVLEQLIEEANGRPVIVFYAYKHERDRIKAKYPEAVEVNDKDAIQRWDAGKVSMLLAHPASAGHGLNLQFGGHIAIWFNLTWSLELYQQANKRLHRIGQTETVLIHHIIVKDCIDARIVNEVLTAKERTQSALIDALRAEIGENVRP